MLLIQCYVDVGSDIGSVSVRRPVRPTPCQPKRVVATTVNRVFSGDQSSSGVRDGRSDHLRVVCSVLCVPSVGTGGRLTIEADWAHVSHREDPHCSRIHLLNDGSGLSAVHRNPKRCIPISAVVLCNWLGDVWHQKIYLTRPHINQASPDAIRPQIFLITDV